MVLTAACVVWCRMLTQRDGENYGGSGRGLIELDLHLLSIIPVGYTPNSHGHQYPSRIDFYFTLFEIWLG